MGVSRWAWYPTLYLFWPFFSFQSFTHSYCIFFNQSWVRALRPRSSQSRSASSSRNHRRHLLVVSRSKPEVKGQEGRQHPVTRKELRHNKAAKLAAEQKALAAVKRRKPGPGSSGRENLYFHQAYSAQKHTILDDYFWMTILVISL